MFNCMKNTTAAVTLSIAALAASGALAGQSVSDIDVTTEISAPQGSNALDLYPTMADDLERALIERVDVANDPGGATMTVKIKRVSLDGDTILPDSAEFNELEGYLSYVGGSSDVVQNIKLSAYSDESAVPAGAIAVPPSKDDFYDAMLTAFADRIVELVPEKDIKTDG